MGRRQICGRNYCGKGLKQETDTGAIEAIIKEVLAANEKMVEEYKSGKEKAFNGLVGQVMKACEG